QRSELRLDVDELAVGELAGLHELAQAFDDVRLRRDGIRADHLRAAERDGLGDRMGSFRFLKHWPPLLQSPRLPPPPPPSPSPLRRGTSRVSSAPGIRGR